MWELACLRCRRLGTTEYPGVCIAGKPGSHIQLTHPLTLRRISGCYRYAFSFLQSAKPVLVTGFFILASHTCPVAQSRKPNRCRF